ncbi:hypothetical protein E4T56_gene6377 [Termitomyces sp. T112]|nr:hypothetical protein E4T56_gene6377 [Termitomyces sp. T112]
MSLSVDNQRGFEADSITSNSLRSFPASSTSQSTNTLAGLGVTTPTTVVIFPNTATVTSNIDSRPVQRTLNLFKAYLARWGAAPPLTRIYTYVIEVPHVKLVFKSIFTVRVTPFPRASPAHTYALPA